MSQKELNSGTKITLPITCKETAGLCYNGTDFAVLLAPSGLQGKTTLNEKNLTAEANIM